MLLLPPFPVRHSIAALGCNNPALGQQFSCQTGNRGQEYPIPFLSIQILYLAERATILNVARPGRNGILVFHFRPVNLLFCQKEFKLVTSGPKALLLSKN